jgi:hypothetical protein
MDRLARSNSRDRVQINQYYDSLGLFNFVQNIKNGKPRVNPIAVERKKS